MMDKNGVKTKNINVGNIIEANREPYRVLNVEKENFMSREYTVTLKNMFDGAVYKGKFDKNETFKTASVRNQEMEAVYNDGTSWILADAKTFQERAIPTEKMPRLEKGDKVTVSFYEGKAFLEAEETGVVNELKHPVTEKAEMKDAPKDKEQDFVL